MRILGIDYGTRRIGLAIGDVEHGIAFPREVIQNDEHVLERIQSILEKERVEEIVIGRPEKLTGKQSDLLPEITEFIQRLGQASGLIFHLENEVFSTKAVYQGSTKRERIDAASAALILQGYLDRIRKEQKPQG